MICFKQNFHSAFSFPGSPNFPLSRSLRTFLMSKIRHDKALYEILEQRQNKNDSIQSEIIPILKLPLFSPDRIGVKKRGNFIFWNYL